MPIRNPLQRAPAAAPTDTTPLLGGQPQHNSPDTADPESIFVSGNGTRGQDHPIFLRTCHAPWSWIGQSALSAIRAILVMYMTAAGIMVADYLLEKRTASGDYSGWTILFELPTISYVLAYIYQVLAFAWTVTHFHFPNMDPDDTAFESIVVRFLGPPDYSYRKQAVFSFFYSVINVFEFLSTLLYWGFMVPRGLSWTPDGTPPDLSDPAPFRDAFDHGWFHTFAIVNLYIVPAAILIFETLMLNSIRQPNSVVGQLIGTMVLAAGYLGWAALGGNLTGNQPLFFLDPQLVPTHETVVAFCIGFVLAAAALFIFLYGLVGLREQISNFRLPFGRGGQDPEGDGGEE